MLKNLNLSDFWSFKISASWLLVYTACVNISTKDCWSQEQLYSFLFASSQVWEVKAADLSISPVHRAANGIVDPNKVGSVILLPYFLYYHMYDEETKGQTELGYLAKIPSFVANT